MSKKELLYKKLGALRLEVHSSIVDDIVATANEAFQEQYLQQYSVSSSLPLLESTLSSIIEAGDDYWEGCEDERDRKIAAYQSAIQLISELEAEAQGQ